MISSNLDGGKKVGVAPAYTNPSLYWSTRSESSKIPKMLLGIVTLYLLINTLIRGVVILKAVLRAIFVASTGISPKVQEF